MRYTDPTGYFSIADVLAAMNILAKLAATSSIGFGAGYITGGVITGASGEEILQMFGDFGAGFAEGVSGGFLTDVYEATTGKKVEPFRWAASRDSLHP